MQGYGLSCPLAVSRQVSDDNHLAQAFGSDLAHSCSSYAAEVIVIIHNYLNSQTVLAQFWPKSPRITRLLSQRDVLKGYPIKAEDIPRIL